MGCVLDCGSWVVNWPQRHQMWIPLATGIKEESLLAFSRQLLRRGLRNGGGLLNLARGCNRGFPRRQHRAFDRGWTPRSIHDHLTVANVGVFRQTGTAEHGGEDGAEDKTEGSFHKRAVESFRAS